MSIFLALLRIFPAVNGAETAKSGGWGQLTNTYDNLLDDCQLKT